ncbi:methyl-coenzyme M reductase operon protein D [Methanolacinia paynteri]|uniref:methyl-coenzyme M reductase operon protein D n=1 Tax=Methanolacinia paynteri TaxID=230356 RepID=UPI00064F59E9|nr:methyl-coenzyme M reductase operon protein D [Methanolacinia paynteri]
MTESHKNYPQCKIVPIRMLSPETAEKFLNLIVRVKGIRRFVINGPSLPKTVPYGPARGKPNANSNRRVIQIGDTETELRVQVGVIILEVEERSVIDEIRKVTSEFFEGKFSCQVLEGKFMKTEPTTSDYAKYGPNADEMILGLVDPRKKEGPVIIQGLK